MTPAEHYAEAERLLGAAKEDVRTADEQNPAGRDRQLDRASIALACAGVHARLAGVSDQTAYEVKRADDAVVRCRVCGCTDDDCSQCIAKQGFPCAWVEPHVDGQPNLCTACVA